MRKLLLGVVFTLGCGAPAVGVSSSAVGEEPPTPTPPWCSNCPERGLRTVGIRPPVFDPLQLTKDYGRPELLPEITRRVELLSGRLAQVTTEEQVRSLTAAFTAELDLLAQ
jgi:hypothetical protein